MSWKTPTGRCRLFMTAEQSVLTGQRIPAAVLADIFRPHVQFVRTLSRAAATLIDGDCLLSVDNSLGPHAIDGSAMQVRLEWAEDAVFMTAKVNPAAKSRDVATRQ